MLIENKFDLGEKVKIFDSPTVGHVQGFYITNKQEIKYDVCYFTGTARNSDYFREKELSLYVEAKKVGFETGE